MRASRITTGAICCAAALWLSCGASTPPPDHRIELCENGTDDDADQKTDCADPDCFSAAPCLAAVEDCDNKTDDDGDSLVDCADPGCAEASECISPKEICTGGFDEDADGMADCADPDCAASPGCWTTENCTDSKDNDGDTLVDCADPNCSGLSCGTGCSCANGVKKETTCGDSADNDGDLSVDCLDLDCASLPSCAASTESNCSDGVDNDGDTRTDCADTDCASAPACSSSTEAGQCNDGLDNDSDFYTDCGDPDCAGASCGSGCQCAAGAKKEIACGDGSDNDGDSAPDCSDSDCLGAGTEVCNDGIDNTCDRAVDCADPKCNTNALCVGLSDGAPCSADAQCQGGKCRTESATGSPNGACSNAVSCNPSTQAGCAGGICIEDGAFDVCLMKCTGTGLGATGKCRAGYVCVDSDASASNSNNFCMPLCGADSQCAGSGAGYGCNAWSKLCSIKDKGLGKYGAACSSGAACESGLCRQDYPGGYCIGLCAGDTLSCGGDGVCYYFASYGDNMGECMDGCTSSGQCRSAIFSCVDYGQGNICMCGGTNTACDYDSDCCSNSCFYGYCD